ncbi:MAG: hypothetical protein HKN21_05265, partial [Candidatus Eisenbacteria bacterium]|nr:hypothetical protein [Candidatus Eisenbacteria bacterium]
MSTTATPPTGAELESTLGRLRAFENLDPSTGPVHVHKLVGSSKRLLAAHLFRKHQRSVLYVTANEDRAEAARQDLKIYLGEKSFHLVGHETDPYQSKHPDTET